MDDAPQILSEQGWREAPVDGLVSNGTRWIARLHALSETSNNTLELMARGRIRFNVRQFCMDYAFFARSHSDLAVATEQVYWYVLERERHLTRMPMELLLQYFMRTVEETERDEYKGVVLARIRAICASPLAADLTSLEQVSDNTRDLDALIALMMMTDQQIFMPEYSLDNLRHWRERGVAFVEAQRQQQSLALAGGLHPRLGAASGLRVMDDELLRHIGGFL